MESKEEFDDEKLVRLFNEKLIGDPIIDINIVKSFDDDGDIINYIYEQARKTFDNRMIEFGDNLKASVPDDVLVQDPDFVEKNKMMLIKRIILPILDKNWREHIDDMDSFRQGVYLQQYAQSNPLEIYQREGYQKFENLNRRMNEQIFITAMHARVRFDRAPERKEDELKGLSTNQDLSRVRQQQPAQNPFVNVGPNDACPCGSGKKFKFCHGLK
jgi:preprotein translocase subunit SecA